MIYIHKSKDKQFYFTVTARNGRVLLTSETYKKKVSCRDGIEALLKSLDDCKEIEDKTDVGR